MAIKFETYLVDEVTSVGDATFKKKSKALFNERMRSSGSIVVSHSMSMLRDLCNAGAVIENGELSYYDDLNDAIKHYEDVINDDQKPRARAKRKKKRRADQVDSNAAV